MSEWISVKDRLPEIDEPVMVVAYGKADLIAYVRTRTKWEHPYNKHWALALEDVTHWLPIPEVPSDE